MTVPAGSTLVVRATGQSGLDVAVKGGIAEAKPEAKPQVPKGTEERQFTITAAGTATVKGGGEDVVWTFNATPDRAADHRARQGAGSRSSAARCCSHYKIEDDYGVVDAQATFERKRRPSPHAGTEAKPPRPLFDAPNFTLVLPQARTRAGAGTDHQGSVGASVGRRRRGDDARRPRRGQQRGPLRRRTRCGCRSGRSPSRCRAR